MHGEKSFAEESAWLRDGDGKELLYEAQIRSSFESCLAWEGADTTSLNILDRIQERVKKLIKDRTQPHQLNLD